MLAGAYCAADQPSPNQSGVIGKPFHVSASVTAFCALKPPAPMCEAFAPQLAEFLAESRDDRWAAPVERLIAKSMLVKGKPWAQIRALECRRTRCALEYAVNAKDLGADVDGNEELDRLMESTGGVMVPDPSSTSGGGMLVSVLIWRKH